MASSKASIHPSSDYLCIWHLCFLHSCFSSILEIRKMPRTRANAAVAKAVESVKPVEPEEQVELDDPEDTMEEEVEYEEVEEEIEEVEEEEEEEVEEEEDVEEDVDETAATNVVKADAAPCGDDRMKEDEREEGESDKHAELLALPPHGSEVYVGGIPHDTSEEGLKSFCESVGEVTEVRLMKSKDSAENKGYAFVTFRTKELATKAIEELNNTEFKGKKIKCSTSQAKHRLFIGNVPRSWVEDDLKKVVKKIGPGVNKVDLMKDPQNSSRNRGYAFIEYYNHACAEYSRKKMSTPKFKLDSNAPTVSWADPKSGDSSSSSQVKFLSVLFAKPPADKKNETVANAQKGALLPNYPPHIGPGLMGGAYGPLMPGFGQPMIYGRGQTPAGMAMVPMILPDGRLGYVLQQPGAPLPSAQRGGGGGGGGGGVGTSRGGNSHGGRKSNDNDRGRDLRFLIELQSFDH
ncbi:hypothetical protein J5N97_003885 [Dioscorea zingiberensis]|uniref:RRM domain-containing protein n=1 Tax=Dioscorea zingiberensis TaxID=325984 RepID=A0A9D5D6A9_9LILI|nr:hypothetical protein J5N97_003885 [Dioscorea zingiberensis]